MLIYNKRLYKIKDLLLLYNSRNANEVKRVKCTYLIQLDFN